jgi:hypothetical protein
MEVVTWHVNESKKLYLTTPTKWPFDFDLPWHMSTEGHKEKRDKKRKTLEAGLEDVDMADATSKVCNLSFIEFEC